MVSISMLWVAVAAVFTVFAVSTIAVIVLCRRAPIWDELDGEPVNAWTQQRGTCSAGRDPGAGGRGQLRRAKQIQKRTAAVG